MQCGCWQCVCGPLERIRACGSRSCGSDSGCAHSGSNSGLLRLRRRFPQGRASWGSVGHEHRTFGWLVVPPAAQRCYPGACAPAVLRGARLRSGVRDVTAAERRCARTAPCIGNEIDRYHKALICQLSIYYYLLHNSIGLLLSAHILLLSTSPTTEPARFPTVVIPRISRHSSVYTCRDQLAILDTCVLLMFVPRHS